MLKRLLFILKVCLAGFVVLSSLSIYQDGFSRYLNQLPNSLAFGMAMALWWGWPISFLYDEVMRHRSIEGANFSWNLFLRVLGESIFIPALASLIAGGLPIWLGHGDHHYLSGSGNFGFLMLPLFSVITLILMLVIFLISFLIGKVRSKQIKN